MRDVEHIVKNAPIYLRYDNLIHEVTLKSKSDEYVTALAVTGGDDLDIRSVNPIGGTYLYNFDYAMTTGQMSEGLVQAITAWNERIDSNQNRYATLLTEYKNLNSEMVRIDSDLRAIQTELDAAERVMQVNIDAGKTDLSEDRQKIREITRRKTEKETEKDAKQGAIDACRTKISDITDELAMENNFTTDLIGELSQHIVESSYQNENIIKTSSMSNAEIQEQAQELYEIGKHV